MAANLITTEGLTLTLDTEGRARVVFLGYQREREGTVPAAAQCWPGYLRSSQIRPGPPQGGSHEAAEPADKRGLIHFCILYL